MAIVVGDALEVKAIRGARPHQPHPGSAQASDEAVKRIEDRGPEISPFLGSAQIGCFRPSPWAINYLLQRGESELFLAHAAGAMEKVRTEREVRQLQDLIAAIRYWQMAAEVFAVETWAEQADRAGHNDVAVALYEEVLRRVKPVVDYVQAQRQRGWISNFGEGVVDQFRRNTAQHVARRIEELRQKKSPD